MDAKIMALVGMMGMTCTPSAKEDARQTMRAQH